MIVAASFLDALAAGAFDGAQSDTGLKAFVRPYTTVEKRPRHDFPRRKEVEHDVRWNHLRPRRG